MIEDLSYKLQYMNSSQVWGFCVFLQSPRNTIERCSPFVPGHKDLSRQAQYTQDKEPYPELPRYNRFFQDCREFHKQLQYPTQNYQHALDQFQRLILIQSELVEQMKISKPIE